MKFITDRFFLIGLSFLFLVPNLIPKPKYALENQGHPWEKFDANLVLQLHTISDVLRFTDSLVSTDQSDTSKFNYANELANVVRSRFYHGYSYYSLHDNWIAAALGSIARKDLSAVVLPNDILNYPMAACSQQSIVMMECFKRRGIDFRKVGFDHHFALEAFLNGKWYFFDPDMEPDFSKNPRTSIDSILKKKDVYLIYDHTLNPEELDYMLGNQFYGSVNEPPAPLATPFQYVTKFLSKTLWLFPLGLLVIFNRRRKNYLRIKEQSDQYVIAG